MAFRQTFVPSSERTKTSINLFATEILVAIFILAVPHSDGSARHTTSLRLRVPLLLTEVCHRWRAIAHATPGLWNSIAFTEPRRERSCSHFSLIRSGLVDWFSHTSSRSLSFSASFRANGFGASNIAARVPWSRLAHLYLKDDSFSPLAIIKVLRQCPQLVTCHIEGVNCHEYETVTHNDLYSVALLSLSSLKLAVGTFWTVTSTNQTTMSAFPGVLHMPSLKSLEIQGHPDIEHDWLLAQCLMPRVLHSRGALTRLVVRDISFSVDSFRVFLILLPTLEYLHLTPKRNRRQKYPSLLRHLSYVPEKSHNILPHLEVLIIEDNVLDAASSDQVVLQMVETRRWTKENYPYQQKGLRELKELHISWLNVPVEMAPNPVAHERAIALQTGGLEIIHPTLGFSR